MELEAALTGDTDYESLGSPLLVPYFLDRASAIAARALEPAQSDSVLDLCAAPGGKTLVMAQMMAVAGANRPRSPGMEERESWEEAPGNDSGAAQSGALGPGRMKGAFEGTIVANERSASRRSRLHRVLEEHLPLEIRTRIRVTGHDARTWGMHEREQYERVLLDAPCSSEAHLLASPRYLDEWSPSRSRQLSIRQHALIAAAIDAARPGAMILYCTCAVSPLENDEVVRWALKRRGGVVEIDRPAAADALAIIEPTEFGSHIWPDVSPGHGPIFFSRLRKIASSA